ncbi:MAG TPA: hypothetical protein VFN94_01415 [Nitrospiria bacterium]|nr:hypothetical protein [Nitrospiria bacterium]
MRVPWRIGVGVIALVMSGCGRVAEPVVPTPCSSGECWDLSSGAEVLVNDEPAWAELGPDEAHAWRFHAIPGHQYLVLTRVFSGSADTYASTWPTIDPFTHPMVDVRSGSGLSFTASGSIAYLAVADRGNAAGSAYTVRVVSYDESLDPLPGTARLTVNGLPAPRALASGELARFVFDAIRGADYTVTVITSRGATETYVSLIPSVDDDFFDVAGESGAMPFRATETGAYYVAVVDRSGSAGADIAIRVTSP